MARIRADSKAAFQAALERRLSKQDKSAQLRRFAEQYFSQVPLAELVQKDWTYAVGSLLSSWRLYHAFNGERAEVQVFNPTVEHAGYEDRHTVVEVACRNLPFLLDSIRIALSEQEIVLSDVRQCLLSVVRDGGNKLVFTEDPSPNETLIRLEVDRVASTGKLERSLRGVIRQVRRVVDDFAPIRKQLLLWSDEFGSKAQASGADRSLREQYEFLRWLYSNNFTFLAYEEFDMGSADIGPVKSSRLGLARKGYQYQDLAVDLVPSGDDELIYSKAPLRSRVHRPAYMDCITIRAGGRMCRFTGLFTSSVFNQSPMDIPLVRMRVGKVFEDAGLSPTSHKGRELGRIIEVLPREELFLASPGELSDMVARIFSLQERRIVRVLARRDLNGHFVSCLVYVPRDAYDTNLRLKVQEILVDRFDASDVDFSTFFSESTLIRTHFVLRVGPAASCNVDVDEIERLVTDLTRSWEDELHTALTKSLGEQQGEDVFRRVGHIFPPGYKDDYWPTTACSDIEVLLGLSEENPIDVSLYQWMVGGEPEIRFKVFHRGGLLPLSDVIPILENLGAKTLEERPYEVMLEGRRISIHDFVLEITVSSNGRLEELRSIFEQAFQLIWFNGKENDGFNRLVPAALMDYRAISVIRAYSRYLGQIQSTSSQHFIADCVVRYPGLTTLLFELFDRRFNPALQGDESVAETARIKAELLAHIDAVENLAEDRVLRRYCEMILATVRTNYYQRDSRGASKDYIALKFLPTQISEMPEPKPRFEIFVYSPRVEGVHLRGGKVARGGLRWSDRVEDYRTEVLGLVKAQQVKNSVIVPVGAKGGFLPKLLPVGAGREEVYEEGVACYRIFISALLDVTDNLIKGKVSPPEGVVRYDDDDYYLVVAADKGTAAFSDIANEISAQYGFWLGDAFASGGSVGYDHKAMGITARGAWKSVQQHFRDLGTDIQKEPFTVVGIGDMSGDVFGNGMLLSSQIRLVAAFNHLHIFVDPEPDVAASFAERKRLFELPRSGWNDYNTDLVSKGGGIFSRSAKSITLTKEMKARFDISASTLTPTALISAILKSRVDLLWNGGIGTYVKSAEETHVDVGDKANDQLRVNGRDLRCRVVGEGGNLGLTQLARIEYCLNGGYCFTDFIDNAGGVNCSDAEVNIKILLNQLVEEGKLTSADRRNMLRRMTSQVCELVLDNNYRQAQAINLMAFQAQGRGFEYVRVMNILAEHGGLDPQLEYLPGEDEMQERRAKGKTFAAPELAVLSSYLKAWLKVELAEPGLLDDPYMIKEMHRAFPRKLVDKYADELSGHRLRHEVVATQIANDLVNRMGINFVTRMSESAGVESRLIARAYIGARDIFGMEERWQQIRALDYRVDPDIQKQMMLDLIRLIRRATRWLLRNRRHSFNLQHEVPRFQRAQAEITRHWRSITADGAVQAECDRSRQRLLEAGVGDELASFVGAAHSLYNVLGIVEASNRTGEPVRRVAALFFAVGERLHLPWISREIYDFQAATQWETLARESIQDDLNWQQLAITLGVIGERGGKSRRPVAELIDRWAQRHELLLDRWQALYSEMRATPNRGPAVFTVAVRELLDLAQSSASARARF